MYNAQNLGERIKRQAREKNILIRDLLTSCDLSINTISQMTDKKGLSSFSLAKIADYLDCSVDYLLGRTDEPHMRAKKICNHGNSVAFGDSCNNNSVEIGNVKEHDESESKNEDEELLQLFHSLPIYLRAEFILAMHNKVIEQKEKENTKDTN